MSTDAALLALVVDDADSIKVLAAWAALAPVISVTDECIVPEISSICGIPQGRVTIALKKLRASRTLVDGGITDLADKMLQTIVQQRLSTTPRSKR